jgi:chromosome segregation ATPase
MSGEHSPTTSARQAVVALEARLAKAEAERDELKDYLAGVQPRLDAVSDRINEALRYRDAAKSRVSALEALLTECETVLHRALLSPRSPHMDFDADRALVAKLNARQKGDA